MPSKFNLLYLDFAGILLHFEQTFQTVLQLWDTADLYIYILGTSFVSAEVFTSCFIGSKHSGHN